MIKKFFQDSGPQFIDFSDFWIEEFCRKLYTIDAKPGSILKARGKDADRLFILIRGRVSVTVPRFASTENILVNEYLPGQSFCDPLLNETADATAQVQVISGCSAKMLCIKKRCYIQIFIDKINERANQRLLDVQSNFQPFNSWEDTRLKNLLLASKYRVLNSGECLVRED